MQPNPIPINENGAYAYCRKGGIVIGGIQLSAGVEVNGKTLCLPVQFLQASAARLWVAARSDSSNHDSCSSDYGKASLSY